MTENMIYPNKTKTNLDDYEGGARFTPMGVPRYDYTKPVGQIGNEIEYRGLAWHELAHKIGLTEDELNDVIDDKRSFWKVDVVPEGSNSIPNNRMPYEPTHPGDILKEEIEYRNLDLTQLADELDIPLTELTDILDCKKPVTHDHAQKFEKVLGLTAQTLTGLQNDYDIEVVLIPMRNLKRLEKEKIRKQQEKRVTMQEWQHRRQAVHNKQRVAVRTPATVGRELVPI
jgi:addiction module HigA family antidote